MNRICGILLSLVLVSSNAFTQQYPRSIVFDADTCVIFTINQSKKLIVWNTQKKECFDLKSIMQSELEVKDSVISQNEQKIMTLRAIEESYQRIVVEKNQLKLICEAEKQDYKSAIKRERRQKWLGVGAGIVTTSFMTYLFVTK